MKNIKETFNEN